MQVVERKASEGADGWRATEKPDSTKKQLLKCGCFLFACIYPPLRFSPTFTPLNLKLPYKFNVAWLYRHAI